MLDSRFPTPVIAILPLTKEGPRTRALGSSREGIQAIYQHGLGGFRFESPEFLQIVEKLARAVRTPTPENLGEARAALEDLADANAVQSTQRPVSG